MWTNKWVPVEARRGHWIPWSGVASSCELLDLTWVLRTELMPSAGAVSILNHWVISPVLLLLLKVIHLSVVSESQTSHSRSLSGHAINDQCNSLHLNVPHDHLLENSSMAHSGTGSQWTIQGTRPSGRKLVHWVMKGTSGWQPFSLSSYKVSSFVPHGLSPVLFCLTIDPNTTGPAHSWLKLLRSWEKKQNKTSLHLNWTLLALFHSYTTNQHHTYKGLFISIILEV